MTFRALDEAAGVIWTTEASEAALPLPQWYVCVRDTPIHELSVRDLCIACRQSIHLDEVVPAALNRLAEDPLAGHKYDGELLAAMRSIEPRFWNSHREDARRLRSIFVEAMGRMDEDQRQDAVALVRDIRE